MKNLKVKEKKEQKEIREFNEYSKLVEKILTYYPNLNTKSNDAMDNAVDCILRGFNDELVKNLRTLRSKYSYTQKEMAQKLNVSQVTYAYWETGAYPPRISKLKEIFARVDFDPSEFISVNPVSPKSSLVKRIPVIPSNFFYGKTIDSFIKSLESYSASDYVTIETPDLYDFAIKVVTNDMVGYDKAISVGAFVLCECQFLKGKDRNEIYDLTTQNVSVVGITHGEAQLRETAFDGEFLTLRCWNPTLPEKRFPIELSFISKLDNPEKAKLHGYETLAGNVEIFGRVKKVILDLV